MNSGSLYDRLLKSAPGLLAVAFLSQMILSSRLEKWVHPEPFGGAEVRETLGTTAIGRRRSAP